MKNRILTIDQGTTGTTVLLIDAALSVEARVTLEFPQIYPQSGWVEHDPETIWLTVVRAIAGVLEQSGADPASIAAIGITNQRETTVIWERESGAPIHNAIVWQCRRTASFCRELRERGLNELFARRTGLVLDPYFSGTKVRWLLDNVAGARGRAESGELAFGTIDSWLVWRLTGGARHATDVTNASRTLMLDLATRQFDDELLGHLGVPRALLPEVLDCASDFGLTRGVPGLPDGIPISGIAGDQQAALFGQCCFSPGDAKITYGTGAFLLMNTGDQAVASEHGLLTTVAWQLDGAPTYALEGSVFIAGAAIQWLRDGLELFASASETEALARSVASSDGVIFVPALTGLGAPHWSEDARGGIFGISRGTTKAHLVRAAIEGVALSCAELLESMSRDLGRSLNEIKVDGGATANNLLLETQANLLEAPIVRPEVVETTALGAAMLAGLGCGMWRSLDELTQSWKEDRRFEPAHEQRQNVEKLRAAWSRALPLVIAFGRS